MIQDYLSCDDGEVQANRRVVYDVVILRVVHIL